MGGHVVHYDSTTPGCVVSFGLFVHSIIISRLCRSHITIRSLHLQRSKTIKTSALVAKSTEVPESERRHLAAICNCTPVGVHLQYVHTGGSQVRRASRWVGRSRFEEATAEVGRPRCYATFAFVWQQEASSWPRIFEPAGHLKVPCARVVPFAVRTCSLTSCGISCRQFPR